MADNIQLNSGTGGATVRTFADAGSVQWPAAVVCYATGLGSPDTLTVPLAAALADATLNPTVITIAVDLCGYNGSTWDRLRSSTANGLQVDVTRVQGSVAVTGTFWQTTQPVSAASLPLPAGAAADSSVNGVLVAQASTTAGQTGPLVQGACTTAAPTYTTAKTEPLSLDTAGNLRTLAAQSGTWNVGTVTAVTAITNALPAGTNLLGQASASAETSTVFNGTTAITPQFATIVASASGATTIVSATAGKRIRVLRWSLSANGAVNAKWQSHVTPTDLTGLHYMTQFSTAGGSYCPVGLFQTVSGEALDINLSGAIAVGGELTYILV